MNKLNLLIALVITFFSLQGCKKDDISCEDDLYLKVIAGWPEFPEGLVKPAVMTAFIYPKVNTGFTRTQIHPDGGSLSSESGRNDLLFYNVQEREGIAYQNMSEYGKAEIVLSPYEEDGNYLIREPYLLYGESFSEITFSREACNTLNYGPELLTHVVRFEVFVNGEKRDHVVSCSGNLSGLSNRINLSTKRSGNENYKVAFSTTKTERTFTKELLHFGFTGRNLLELVFRLDDEESDRSASIDITDLVRSATPKLFNCQLTVYINESGVKLDLSDVSIEPYKPGVNDSITIS